MQRQTIRERQNPLRLFSYPYPILRVQRILHPDTLFTSYLEPYYPVPFDPTTGMVALQDNNFKACRVIALAVISLMALEFAERPVRQCARTDPPISKLLHNKAFVGIYQLPLAVGP